jgi:outer membrane lipoprotein-sorting protein
MKVLLILVLAVNLSFAAAKKPIAKSKPSEALAVEYLKKLQEAWDKALTYQAKFKQVVLDKRLGTREEQEGTITVAKPDKLRWETPSDSGLQILNGKRLVNVHHNKRRGVNTVDIYADASKTVDAKSLKILAGSVRFDEIYTPKLIKDGPKKAELKLIPKGDASETLIAEIDKQSYLLRALITDSADSRVVVEFVETKLNPELEGSLFEFKPGEKDIVHNNP